MDQKTVDKIQSLQAYQELISKRQKIVWPLSVLILLAYFGFILVIAFKPALFGASIAGGVTSVGIVAGLFLIFFVFAVTGFYVHYANKKLEPLTHEIQDQFKSGK